MNRQASRFFPQVLMPCLIFGLLACQGKPAEVTPDETELGVTEPGVAESLSTPCPSPWQAGSGPNHAGLVVSFEGGPRAICVAFEEDSITGFELLQRSGLTIASQYFQNPPGETICEISTDGVSSGCAYPRETCFCHKNLFWSLWTVAPNGGWTSSQIGVSTATVRHGAIQGQVWGAGGTPPPSCTIEDICTSVQGRH